jgi:hypothetical protein
MEPYIRRGVSDPACLPEFLQALSKERAAHCHLLRDIFGNHFCPALLEPSWVTPTGKALAQAMYTDRSFTDLPVLADALEEAGCTNGDILNHCRQPGEHSRGCWAVDLVLGRN